MNEAELRRRARDRIEAGTLPATRPPRRFAGMGSGERCTLCEQLISRNDMEDETEFAEGEVLHVVRFHRPCFDAWEVELTERER